MAKKISYYRNKADTAMQEHYREKELSCESCGKPATTMHHFFTKASSSYLRHDERNLIPICHGCHMAHHVKYDPRIHLNIIEKRGFDWYYELLQLQAKIFKPTIGYYKEQIKKYETKT